jgi:hypothetical protein
MTDLVDRSDELTETEKRIAQFSAELIGAMFLLTWIKVITYQAVFKQTRYLIKMIMEIIADISTFLTILLISMIAYA